MCDEPSVVKTVQLQSSQSDPENTGTNAYSEKVFVGRVQLKHLTTNTIALQFGGRRIT